MPDLARSQVLGDDAEAYDAARPGYPPGVIDLVLQDGPATALDVGCGTGKAARAVIDRGVTVLGVEPDTRMAAVARRHGVDVVCTRLEDWPPVRYDAVLSAQAWHWVDPVLGAAKVADVLPSGGRWTAFWNREDDERVTEVLIDAYGRHAAHLVKDRRGADADDSSMVDDITDGLDATGAFESVEQHRVPWADELTVGDLVARFATSSGHRLLDAEVAGRLHDAITAGLGGPQRPIELAYTTMALTARRR